MRGAWSHHRWWPLPLASAPSTRLARKENKLDANPGSSSPASVNKAVSTRRKAARGTGHFSEVVVRWAVRGLVTITVRNQSEWWRSVTWPEKRLVSLGPACGKKYTEPPSSRAKGHPPPCPLLQSLKPGRCSGASQMRDSLGKRVSSIYTEGGKPRCPLTYLSYSLELS